jgi:hypothetical protein
VTCISFTPSYAAPICCSGGVLFSRLTKRGKGFTVKQSVMTKTDTPDFKSRIWTLDRRTIVLVLADGRFWQVDSSSVRVDINLNNATDSLAPHLMVTPEGFIGMT